MNEIQRISTEEAKIIIDDRKPIGLFYVMDSCGNITGIDNLTGDAWMEDFNKDKISCFNWLNHNE